MQTLQELATAILKIARIKEESWDHKEKRYLWDKAETISKFAKNENDQAFLSCLISDDMRNDSIYWAEEKQSDNSPS